jgi:hypothetical protein
MRWMWISRKPLHQASFELLAHLQLTAQCGIAPSAPAFFAKPEIDEDAIVAFSEEGSSP